MEFSIGLPPGRDTVEHARIAESLGYRRCWLYDSPALYEDVWVSLARVAEATRRVSAQVPIILIGESAGARSSGGTVMQQLRNVDVEALPLEMPAQIEVDLAVLTEAAGVIRAGDLAFAANVNLLTDADEVVVRIEAARAEVELGAEDVAEEESEPGSEGDRT